MGTTSLGIPLYTVTDSADIAGKLNAQASAIDALLVAINPIIRTAKRSSTLTLSSGDNIAAAFPDAGTINVGNIAYGSGVFTVTDAGVYEWGTTFTIDNGAGVVSARAWVNGAALLDGQQGVVLDASVSQYKTTSAPLPPLSAGGTVQLDFFATTAAAGVTLTPRLFWLKRIA